MSLAFEIISDGITVWVNTEEGYCLGRFGRMGIDVHQPPAPGVSSECLFCTHGLVTASDWTTFQQQMQTCHGVDVPDHHWPDRFREPVTVHTQRGVTTFTSAFTDDERVAAARQILQRKPSP